MRILSLRRLLAQTLRAKVAGPDADAKAEAIWGTPGPRWHRADDVIWHVNADAAMYVGGIRSLLLQSLHPGAMAGVAGHSGYKSDPWGRLQRTSAFIAVTTYGPADAAEAAVAQVRAIHERVRGKTDTGEPYRASDPHLLAWVHDTETASFLDAFVRYGDRPLSQAERDAYVAQAALVGEKLGAVGLPRTEAALTAAIEAYRPELRATTAAREAARFLLLDPPIPWAARPGYWMLCAGAVATLPGWARRELGIWSHPVLDRVIGRPLGRWATAVVRWALTDPTMADTSRSRAASNAAGPAPEAGTAA